MSQYMGQLRSSSSTPLISRTPSGPMAAASLIMNKQASASDSLYYKCLKLQKRLALVPGMDKYLELAISSAEESADQQAMLLSQQHSGIGSNGSPSLYGNSGNINKSSEAHLGYWSSTILTFAAGILPAQISCDPVTPTWKLFQQGAPLCLLFNTLNPENKIDLVTSDDLKVCKMSVYKFLSACKLHLKIRDDELFPITSVFSDDTNNLIKVIQAVNFVLDLDSKFDVPEVEMSFSTSDSRAKIVKELVESERKYVQDLEVLLQYKNKLVKAELISSENINMLFPNLAEIVDFQRRFLIGLECHATVPGKYQRIGSVFLHAGTQGFSIYEPWSLFQNSAIEFIQKENENLRKSSTLIESTYELQSFLIKPVQRLCKYPLLLQELVKATDPSWPSYKELNAALATSKEVAVSVNEAQRKSENLQIIKDLQERVADWRGQSTLGVGDLLYSNVGVVKDLLSDGHSSEKEVHCYLFEKVIYLFKEVHQKKSSILSGNKKKSTASLGSLSGSSSSSVNQNANLPQLNLNGMIFISRIYGSASSFTSNYFNSSGYYLTLRWKGNKETGGCVIKFRTEEQLNQWSTTIQRLQNENEMLDDAITSSNATSMTANEVNGNSSGVRSFSNSSSNDRYSSSTEMTARQSTDNATLFNKPYLSSNTSISEMNNNGGGSFHIPKLHSRQKSDVSLSNYQQPYLASYPPLPADRKNRSVSSPASSDYSNFNNSRNSSGYSSISRKTSQSSHTIEQQLNRFSFQDKINIRLLVKNDNLNISVPASASFAELTQILKNKLKLTLGFTDVLRLKYQDEDGDYVRFQRDEDWIIAKEMLSDFEIEESKILNIRVYES